MNTVKDNAVMKKSEVLHMRLWKGKHLLSNGGFTAVYTPLSRGCKINFSICSLMDNYNRSRGMKRALRRNDKSTLRLDSKLTFAQFHEIAKEEAVIRLNALHKHRPVENRKVLKHLFGKGIRWSHLHVSPVKTKNVV